MSVPKVRCRDATASASCCAAGMLQHPPVVFFSLLSSLVRGELYRGGSPVNSIAYLGQAGAAQKLS